MNIQSLFMTNFRILDSEIGRFLFIGSLTVLFDLFIYLFLLAILNISSELSKGLGFSCGAIFAYFANRNFTFNSYVKGILAFSFFWALYVTTLFVNIAVNELGLSFFKKDNFSIGLAFLMATGVSASLNFIGMKYFVFRGD